MCYINYICAVQFDHAKILSVQTNNIFKTKIYIVSNLNNRTY